jgi:cytochrome b561
MLQVFDQDSALMCARHHPAKPRSIRVLHWAVTVLISAALASGYYAFDFSWTADGFFSRDLLFIVHRSSGLLAAVLILAWFTLRIPTLWGSAPRSGVNCSPAGC